MLVFCPEDDPVRTGLQTFMVGRAQHHGRDAAERFRFMLRTARDLDYERYLFFEYDSICLEPKIPDESIECPGAFFGNGFGNSDRRVFRARNFYHPPLYFGRPSLDAWLKEEPYHNSDDEDGMWDRQCATIIERSELASASWGECGFSRNTIEPGSADSRLAVEAVLKGATMIHGIKHPEILELLVSAYRARQQRKAA